MQLNEPQQQAALHVSGPLLVFAGAGSGKTRVITYRVANLLAQHHVPPYRILCVTFTNKAAGEMKERLEQLAGPEIVQDLWVGTFHSVCCRLLRRYHDEVGLARSFVIYDDSDQKAVVNRVIKNLALDERQYPPKQVLSRIHAYKQEGKKPEDVELSPHFDRNCLEVFEGYEAALRRSNAVDFDDLILHIMRIAEDQQSAAGKELRQRFDYLLVDEFQDTNGTQYRLVRALAAHSQNLCVVGDDDQSIYSWRGADVQNIRGFKKDFPGTLTVKLEQNYRSTGNIVAGALGVIQTLDEREPKELWTQEAKGDPIVIRACRDERDEAAQIVRVIEAELAEGTSAQDIAIFYRINAQSRVIEEAFRNVGLPYQIVGGMRFFDRAEVKDILGYLRLIQNPSSDADLMRVINVPARGIGGKTVERLLTFAGEHGTTAFDAIEPALIGKTVGTAAKKKLLQFLTLIRQLQKVSAELKPSELALEIVEQTGYRKVLKDADSAEADARLENLEELIGSIREYETDCDEHNTPANLDGYLERVSLVADIDQVDAGKSVLLMTVHSAKGLEFERVFLTGMEEEMFPYRGIDGNSPDELDEERRLAYVAITRARKRLMISYASTRMIFGQTRYAAPSRFLTDLPADTVKQEGSAWAPQASPYGLPAGDAGNAWGRPRKGYGSAGYAGGARTRSAQPKATSDWEYAQVSPDRPTSPPASTAEGQDDTRVDYDAVDDVPPDDFESAPRAPKIRKGGRVFHKRFGRGIVQRAEPGTPPQVVARFPGFGERKVLANFLRFE